MARQSAIERNDLVSSDALGGLQEIEAHLQNIKKLSEELSKAGVKLNTTTSLKEEIKLLREMASLRKQLAQAESSHSASLYSMNKGIANWQRKEAKQRAKEENGAYKTEMRHNADLFRMNQRLAKARKDGFNQQKGFMSKLSGLAKTMGAAMAGFFAVDSLINLAKQVSTLVLAYDKMHYTMKVLYQDVADLTVANGFLLDVTRRYGLDLRTVTQQFVKFETAAKSAGLTTLQTQQIFDSTSKAAAVMGLRSDELRGVYLALEQMLSKGKVTTEELRRQLGERLPGAFNIMARAIGVNTSELDKMLKAGEVISADVLPAFARQLEKDYKIGAIEEVDNLQSSVNKLTTEWELFVTTLFDSQGYFAKMIVSFMGWTKDFIRYLKEQTEDYNQTRTRVSEETATTTIKNELKGVEKLIDKYRELGMSRSDAVKKADEESKKLWTNRIKEEEDKIKELELLVPATLDINDREQAKMTKNVLSFIEESKSKIIAYKKLLEEGTNLSGVKTPDGDLKRTGSFAFKEKDLKGERALLKKRAEIYKAHWEDLIKDEATATGVKLKFSDNLMDAEIKLANQEKENAIEAADVWREQELDRIEKAKIKYNELKKAGKKFTEEEEKQYQDMLVYEQNLDEDYANKKLKAQEEFEQKSFEITKANELRKLDLKMSLIEEEYNRGRLIENQARLDKRKDAKDNALLGGFVGGYDISQSEQLKFERDEILDGIDKTKKQLALLQAQGRLTTAEFVRLMQILNDYENQLLDNSNSSLELQRQKYAEILGVIQQAFGSIMDIYDAAHEKRMMQIEEEQEALDNQYKRHAELVQNDKDATESLNKWKEIEDAKIEKKRKKAEYDLAKRKKAQAMVDIVINSAVAALKLPADGGLLGLAALPILAALTALQLAAVAAQPLPKYKHGRKGGKAELAVVGDGGRQEVIEGKDGSVRLTPAKDTITWLNQGDKVHKSTTEYKNQLISDIRKDIKEDANMSIISDAIEKGFAKAKVNSQVNIRQNLDISKAMWMFKQINF